MGGKEWREGGSHLELEGLAAGAARVEDGPVEELAGVVRRDELPLLGLVAAPLGDDLLGDVALDNHHLLDGVLRATQKEKGG